MLADKYEALVQIKDASTKMGRMMKLGTDMADTLAEVARLVQQHWTRRTKS